MNRFRFCNSFEVGNSRDAVYYLLAVWKQLAFDPQADELHLTFDTDNAASEALHEREAMADSLRQYVRRVHIGVPAAGNHAEGLPFDLRILFED